MAVPWRTSVEVFAGILRRHGQEPHAVVDVGAAWRAFAEFAQVELAGLAPYDADSDMLIAQWGSHAWSGDRPSLTFTRQLAVPCPDEDGPSDDVDLWQLGLGIEFSDIPAPAGANTDWYAAPPGSARAAALSDMAAQMRRHEPLRVAWRTVPTASQLAFDHVC